MQCWVWPCCHLWFGTLHTLRVGSGHAVAQERLVLDAIQQYFQHEIPEVTFDDEDAFVDVLQQAGLTDG